MSNAVLDKPTEKKAAPKAVKAVSTTAPKQKEAPSTIDSAVYKHTLAEVARDANVSATTIKYYVDHLPGAIDFQGQSRQRRFTDEARVRLLEVRRLLKQDHLSMDQIRAKWGLAAPSGEAVVAGKKPSQTAKKGSGKAKAAKGNKLTITSGSHLLDGASTTGAVSTVEVVESRGSKQMSIADRLRWAADIIEGKV